MKHSNLTTKIILLKQQYIYKLPFHMKSILLSIHEITIPHEILFMKTKKYDNFTWECETKQERDREAKRVRDIEQLRERESVRERKKEGWESRMLRLGRVRLELGLGFRQNYRVALKNSKISEKKNFHVSAWYPFNDRNNRILPIRARYVLYFFLVWSKGIPLLVH